MCLYKSYLMSFETLVAVFAAKYWPIIENNSPKRANPNKTKK